MAMMILYQTHLHWCSILKTSLASVKVKRKMPTKGIIRGNRNGILAPDNGFWPLRGEWVST